MKLSENETFEEFYNRVRTMYEDNKRIYVVKVELRDILGPTTMIFSTPLGASEDQRQKGGIVEQIDERMDF